MKNPFRILSIDGVGILCIIPAKILETIEEKTGLPTFEMFDLIAGTSTGGIIALGLTKPKTVGKQEAKFKAQDLVKLYQDNGSTIFNQPSLFRKFRMIFNQAKFSSQGRSNVLNRYFGDTLLQDALKDVLIASYDIEKRIPGLFTKSNQDSNSLTPHKLFDGVMMKHAAMATSAAPTYFEPYQVEVNNSGKHTLVDGGLFANNPASLATTDVVSNFIRKTRLRTLDVNEILVVSLGTGSLQKSYSFRKTKDWGALQWVKPVIDISMDGNSAAIHNQMLQIFEQATDQEPHYYRFNPILSELNEAMDDASSSNIDALMKLADKEINEHQLELNELCALLVKHKSPWRGPEFM